MDDARYDPKTIEAKWQRVWEDERAFYVANPEPGEPADEHHWYQLEMLPYPSANGIHMGHVLNYTMGDVQTHVRRRSGWHVVRPMGWDAFGLPAENAAIREGGHPREITERNIETIRAQMKRLGWAIDWDREVSSHRADASTAGRSGSSCSSSRHGLAYRKEAPVNWCPNDQTVIANEYIVDGHCERCGARGRAAEHDAVVLQDDRVRRRAARVRPAARRRVAGADEDDPAQLDRPLRGRRDPLPRRRARPRHRRSSRRAPTRCSARRSSSSRRSIRSSRRTRARRRRSTRGTPARAASRSARPRRRRPASSPATTRRTRSTASGSRSGSPTTS